MKLYFHPISSYSQKVLIALYENATAFEPEIIDLMNPEGSAKYKEIYPLGKVPLLELDDGYRIPESSIIIEYLSQHHAGPTVLIPEWPLRHSWPPCSRRPSWAHPNSRHPQRGLPGARSPRASPRPSGRRNRSAPKACGHGISRA